MNIKRVVAALIILVVAYFSSKAFVFQPLYEKHYRARLNDVIKIGETASSIDKKLTAMSIEHSAVFSDSDCSSCHDRLIDGIIRDTTFSLIGSYSVILTFRFDDHDRLVRYNVASDSVSI